MGVQVTLKLPLKAGKTQGAVLERTVQEFTTCFNRCSSVAWDQGTPSSVELHKQTYSELRSEFPELPSQLVISARMKAFEAVRSARARLKRRKRASCPSSERVAIRYDARSYTIDLSEGRCSLATVAGRVKLNFAIPGHLAKYTKGATSSADLLLSRKGHWWLHVVVNIGAPRAQPSGRVVGVDLGLNRPAVTSEGKFLGERRWREVDNRNFRLRRSCQAKGTPSARRCLRRLGGKRNRWARDVDHVLSRRIAESVRPGDVVVLEDLTDIRDRAKGGKKQCRRLHSWSFGRLKSFLEYKLALGGARLVLVDPRHTSQQCSRCGYIERGNRQSQSVFRCRHCDFSLNADLNAARNIRDRYLAESGMSALGGPSVNRPIVVATYSG